jgi:hypothetical protein
VRFYETEREAYLAALEWAASRRIDWDVTAPVEIFRREGPWTRNFVAPFYRERATPKVRIYQARARGPFARDDERYKGTASAVFEAAFPA